MVFVENFILFSAVKEFWRSLKIWESYCQKFGGFLFWNTVYMSSWLAASVICQTMLHYCSTHSVALPWVVWTCFQHFTELCVGGCWANILPTLNCDKQLATELPAYYKLEVPWHVCWKPECWCYGTVSLPSCVWPKHGMILRGRLAAGRPSLLKRRYNRSNSLLQMHQWQRPILVYMVSRFPSSSMKSPLPQP